MIVLEEKRCEDCAFAAEYSYNLLLCQFHDDLVCKENMCFMWKEAAE